MKQFSVISSRWNVLERIGYGTYGDIYLGVDVNTSEEVAIKIEKNNNIFVLKNETITIKYLQSCPYVPRYIGNGESCDFKYLVIERLGPNLNECQQRQKTGKFSLLTTLKLGIDIVNILQHIHDSGYIHRDIKPSNFVIGFKQTNRIFIIDFGLARNHILSNGQVRPARQSNGFRGTPRYASINSHMQHELGRLDDLWSLLYILIEFAKGELPWKHIKDKDEILKMKVHFNNPNLVINLPPEFLHFMHHIQTLKYVDRPDYQLLIEHLKHRFQLLGGDDDTSYDWENVQMNIPLKGHDVYGDLSLIFGSYINDISNHMIKTLSSHLDRVNSDRKCHSMSFIQSKKYPLLSLKRFHTFHNFDRKIRNNAIQCSSSSNRSFVRCDVGEKERGRPLDLRRKNKRCANATDRRSRQHKSSIWPKHNLQDHQFLSPIYTKHIDLPLSTESRKHDSDMDHEDHFDKSTDLSCNSAADNLLTLEDYLNRSRSKQVAPYQTSAAEPIDLSPSIVAIDFQSNFPDYCHPKKSNIVEFPVNGLEMIDDDESTSSLHLQKRASTTFDLPLRMHMCICTIF